MPRRAALDLYVGRRVPVVRLEVQVRAGEREWRDDVLVDRERIALQRHVPATDRADREPAAAVLGTREIDQRRRAADLEARRPLADLAVEPADLRVDADVERQEHLA